MTPHRCIILLWLVILASLTAGCSNDNSSNTESLNIYEIWATSGSFTAVAGDETARQFQLNLSNQFTEDDDVLYFTNRGAQQAGTFKLGNLISNIWPRVYGSVAPNAILQGKTVTNETVYISCIVDKPILNKATGQLSFSITYLSGQRPNTNLALTDLQLIITNNAATAQPEVWSHNLDGATATLEPSTNADGTYTFRIQNAFGSVLGITCAPQRKTETITTKLYFDHWNTRFGTNPPNVSVSFTDSNILVSQAFIATLSNPVYDEKTGSVSFTAKNVYFPFGSIGKNTLTMKAPTVFIDAGPGGFPTYADNVFSIQVRNSTADEITVWMMKNQPPCSEAVAATGKCDNSLSWDLLADAFKQSGTKFYRILSDGTWKEIEKPSNSTTLKTKEILRIVPPVANGTPQWWWSDGKNAVTAGTVMWVTKSTVSMPSPPKDGGVFEYNVQGGSRWGTVDQKVFWDISAVNGMHFKATMAFEGPGCGTSDNCGCSTAPNKLCQVPLEDYDVNTDGCPYSLTDGLFKTCPNPKFYPYDSLDNRIKPSWVVAPKSFTQSDLDLSQYATWMSETKTAVNGWLDYLTSNGIPLPEHYAKDAITGYVLSDAAIGAVDNSKYLNAKKGYHVWWSTNPVAQNYLKYLQQNNKGNCDAYGWTYDEKKWKTGDSFTGANVDPPENKSVHPNVECLTKPADSTKEGKYLNIDINYIM